MNKNLLVLPPRIYAVAGYETNIYFRNLTALINPNNYAFDVECAKGRLDTERWHWIPNAEEIGTFPMKIQMWSEAGLEDEAQTEIIVSPADAGAGKQSAFLYVGASCTVSRGHGQELYKRFQRPCNPIVTMLGSQAPGYGTPQPGGPAVEAYGGWTWSTFFLKDHVEEIDNADGMHPRRPYDVPSPFLFNKNGQKTFDVPRYIETVCHGIVPDCILFELGINSVFLCKDDAACDRLLTEQVGPYMEKMLSSFKAVAPEAAYGVELIPAGSWSQDAFGANYGCQQSRRRWLLNAKELNLFYLDHAKAWGYECVATNLNVNGGSNYPSIQEPLFNDSTETVSRPSNALHPEDFRQWADAEYFWLKHCWLNH